MKTRNVTFATVGSMLALSIALTGPVIAQTAPTPPKPSASPGAPPSTPPASSTMEKSFVPEGAVVRANAVIGSSVRNRAGEKIGTIDDLLMDSDSKLKFAVLSVGGFLGIGDRLVAIPMSDLQMAADHILYASATKESVAKLPKFDRSAVHYPGYVKDMPRTPPASSPSSGAPAPRPTN
ncbi:MAG TPA: PRC-barrel domain-containing protein [Vineibacter sp.]|nr:PRC-barrel domain-containing protein [Vineibacter sp.]